jgi:hypothetical protein
MLTPTPPPRQRLAAPAKPLGRLAPGAARRLSDEINNLTPAEKKKLAKAMKRLTPQQRARVAQVVAQGMSAKQVPPRLMTRPR